MTVKINKPALNLREELASLRNQGGLPKEDKFYLDNLVTNGDFSNGTTGWLNNSVDSMGVVSGKLEVTKASGTGYIQQIINLVVGKTYTFSATAVNQSGTTNVRLGTTFQGIDIKDFGWAVSGDISHTFKATTSTVYLSLAVGSGTSQFDNVSVQEVGENLVTNGTFDYDGGYIYNGSGWAISGGVATHSGGSGAYIEQHNILKVGKTYTVTFDVTAVSGGGYVQLYGVHYYSGGHFDSVGTHSFTFTSSTTYFRFRSVSGSISIDNVVITEGNHNIIQSIPHGYDVKDVYIDGELAREGEAYDYEVKTDGINQWLKPSVEPTATTETAVIGVRK
jgi:hypothetical protein